MSSRNAYLNTDERRVAGRLNHILHDAIKAAHHGTPIADAEAEASRHVLAAGFSSVDYIAIRDMMVSTRTDRPADPETVKKVRANYDPAKIAEWEEHWGGLENNRSLVHFLLTSPYKENWAREMKEDYLPFNLEDFLAAVPSGYNITHLDHHRHGYSAQRIKKEFDGAELPDNTHVKMILTRRDPLQKRAIP
jgi:hypothetical protein